jgi:Tol biopolymer transport system component
VGLVSNASNLVEGDTNNDLDIFVHDRQTGVTEMVSVSSTGAKGNGRSNGLALTPDGRLVAFSSTSANLVSGDTNGEFDIFVRDRQAGTTERVSVSSSGEQGNGRTLSPAISDDGRFVAFDSLADNLVDGDTNGRWAWDVFVHDRLTGVTEMVSVSSAGVQGSARSDYPDISADGRFVSFHSQASNLVSGDTNGSPDVFVRDRAR